jgi:hypothetical protein
VSQLLLKINQYCNIPSAYSQSHRKHQNTQIPGIASCPWSNCRPCESFILGGISPRIRIPLTALAMRLHFYAVRGINCSSPEVQAKIISVGTMAEWFGGRCGWLLSGQNGFFSTGGFSLVLRRRSRASSYLAADTFFPNPTRFWRNRVSNSYGEVTQRPHVKVNYKVVVTDVDGSRESMITCTTPRILRLRLRLRHYHLLLQSLNC